MAGATRQYCDDECACDDGSLPAICVCLFLPRGRGGGRVVVVVVVIRFVFHAKQCEGVWHRRATVDHLERTDEHARDLDVRKALNLYKR